MTSQPSLNWDSSVWFFDIDDTLINTAELIDVASESMIPVLAEEVGQETAEKIQQVFLGTFATMLAGHRIKHPDDWNSQPELKQKYDQLVDTMTALQTAAIAKHGSVKKWSREIFLFLAAKEVGVPLTADTIHQAAEMYWITLAEKAIITEGAIPLFEEIRRHNRPIFLVTGSDARMFLQDDGQFGYFPEKSEQLKMGRILPLKEKGIHFEAVSIGDPIDKPHRAFYERAIAKAEEHLGNKIDPSNLIMIGDSFESDLRTPKEELGFGLVVLYDKNKNGTEVIDERHIVTSELEKIAGFLKE